MTGFHTIATVWYEYRRWAAAARAGKASVDTARTRALQLGVAGTILGGIASGLAIFAPDLSAGVGSVAGFISAAAGMTVAAAGHLGKDWLSARDRLAWVHQRHLAEALKRESWLAWMLVPPYDGEDAKVRLEARVQRLIGNRAYQCREVAEEGELPKHASIEDYIAERVEDQIAWYSKRSQEGQDKLDRWTQVPTYLGLGAALLGAGGLLVSIAAVAVPVLTAIAAAILAWLSAQRLDVTVRRYQEARFELQLLLAGFEGLSGAQSRDAEQAFVLRCEQAMARENEAWRADWLDDERAEEELARLSSSTEPGGNEE